MNHESDAGRARERTVRQMLGWRGPVVPAPAPVSVEPDSVARARKRSDVTTRAKRLLGLLALSLLLFVSACSDARTIVLWHAYQGAERDALVAAAARWNTAHPERPLELVGVPYTAFADKLTSAIPGGNGPDLFIYSQDRIGDWADAQIIEPLEFWIDDARAARFTESSLASLAYKGSQWALPIAAKSLVLYYRTDLVPTPPRTTDELIALTPKMKAREGYAVAYANADLYGHAPWLFGYGGTVLDGDRLAIATPEAAAAMKFARELVVTGASPPSAEGPAVATLFNEGRAATAISGPWFISGIAPTVPWKVAVLPIVSATGKPATPFLGAEGIVMSARAHDKEAAFAAMDELTSDVAAIERARLARTVVPNPRAYDDPEVAKDQVLRAYRDQLAHTVPMPVSSAMRMVWTPYQTALGEVLAGNADPGARLLAVEREVAGYIAGAKAVGAK